MLRPSHYTHLSTQSPTCDCCGRGLDRTARSLRQTDSECATGKACRREDLAPLLRTTHPQDLRPLRKSLRIWRSERWHPGPSRLPPLNHQTRCREGWPRSTNRAQCRLSLGTCSRPYLAKACCELCLKVASFEALFSKL